MPGMPEITRVCEEAEGEFEHFIEGSLRPAAGLQLFGQDQLFAFQIGDAALVGRDDAQGGCFDDAVEQVGDLLFGLVDVAPDGRADRRRL